MKTGSSVKFRFVIALFGFVFFGMLKHAIGENPVLVSELDESVVRIFVFENKSKELSLSGSGSGFIVADGIIVTNRHVIKDADKVTIVQKRGSAIDEHDAEILWASPDVDLAIIRSRGVHGRSVSISSVVPGKGAEVLAIGFPGVADVINSAQTEKSMLSNFAESTITKGIVGRTVTVSTTESSGVQIDVLQHSAQINSGNSGGPLFNGCGSLIGVNTAKALGQIEMKDDRFFLNSSEGVYWAVGSETLAKVLQSQNIKFTRVDTDCQNGPIAASEPTANNGTDSNPLLIVAVILAVGMSIFAIVFVNRIQRRGEGRAVRPERNIPVDRDLKFSSTQSKLASKWIFKGSTSEGQPVHLVLRKNQFDGQQRVLIGRDERICALAIDDSSVSRHHARLEYRSDQLFICDLDSRNGTRVNEDRVGSQGKLLSPPCTLTLGTVVLNVTSVFKE